jgi:hypothetical protein
MLYVTRNRLKETVTGEQLGEINRLIDAETIPAIEKVEGVRSVRAYNSITGDLTFVLDIQDMATVDRILADPGVRAGMAGFYDLTVRTGGEVLYDRPAWQGLYGRG